MTGSVRDREAGVTLIEMLVAVAICALIGLAGFGTLDTILRVTGRAEGDLDRFADLDRAFLVLGRDLIAADTRDLRVGEGVLRLRTAGGDDLGYGVRDGVLIRQIGTPEVTQMLVTGVATVEWQVLDTQGKWQTEWQEGLPDAPLPRAIALRLDLVGTRRGEVRRLFRLTPGPAS